MVDVVDNPQDQVIHVKMCGVVDEHSKWILEPDETAQRFCTNPVDMSLHHY